MLQQQYKDVQSSTAKLHSATTVSGFEDNDENTRECLTLYTIWNSSSQPKYSPRIYIYGISA